MNYWLFKVSTKKFEQGYPDEFKSLNDKPFFKLYQQMPLINLKIILEILSFITM